MAVSKSDKDMKFLIKENERHQGEWLTPEVVAIYQAKAAELPGRDDVGKRRKLRDEFQKRYGLQELEAINILNGFLVDVYLRKYERIQNLIPLIVEKDRKNFSEEDNENE